MPELKFEYFTDITLVENSTADVWIQRNVEKMFREDLKNFAGKRVKITVEKLRSKRSLAQNALFHMYVGILARDLGYGGRDGFEEMKEIIKFKFCKGEKVDERSGEILPYIRPTHTLGKGEFIELIDSVIRWAATTFGITLPAPAEYGFEPDIENGS